MSWPPNQHIQVFDERPLKDNFLAFLEANQVDALAWANTGSVGALDPISQFQKAAKLTSVFPSLTILQTEHGSAFGSDLLGVVFSMTLELAVVHGNQDTLTDLAAKYAMAVESMIANMPETTFGENSIIPITSTLREMKTVFDVQGKIKNRFIQVSQTEASWIIDAAVENS
jgi:CRISPR/Cas system-associated exonuclease Cas4 (RecB family)